MSSYLKFGITFLNGMRHVQKGVMGLFKCVFYANKGVGGIMHFTCPSARMYVCPSACVFNFSLNTGWISHKLSQLNDHDL